MIHWRAKTQYWLAIVLIHLLACGFQTTFWYQLTGSMAAPQLWLNIVLYLFLYRSWQEAFLASYGLGLIAMSFSISPLKVLWPTLLFCGLITRFIRERFFWSNTRYFFMAGFFFAFLFNLIYWTTTYSLEESMPHPTFLYRTLEILLTGLWSPPFFWVLQWVDSFFAEDHGPHIEVSE